MGKLFLTFTTLSLLLLLPDQPQQGICLIQRPTAIPFPSVHVEYLLRDREIYFGGFEIFARRRLRILQILVPRDLRHFEDMET